MNRTYTTLLLAAAAALAISAFSRLEAIEKVTTVAARSTDPSPGKLKDTKYDQKAFNVAAGVKPLDWPQWGGSSMRNNVPEGKNIPHEWKVGDFDSKTGEWHKDKSENIKWAVK